MFELKIICPSKVSTFYNGKGDRQVSLLSTSFLSSTMIFLHTSLQSFSPNTRSAALHLLSPSNSFRCGFASVPSPAVERRPLRFVFEEAHCFDVLERRYCQHEFREVLFLKYASHGALGIVFQDGRTRVVGGLSMVPP